MIYIVGLKVHEANITGQGEDKSAPHTNQINEKGHSDLSSANNMVHALTASGYS